MFFSLGENLIWNSTKLNLPKTIYFAPNFELKSYIFLKFEWKLKNTLMVYGIVQIFL